MRITYDAYEQRQALARLMMYRMVGGTSYAQGKALRGKIRNLAAATGISRRQIEARARADAQILIDENI